MAQGARQRGCLGPDAKKISSLLYTYKFFKETKLKKFTIESNDYIAMLLYLFFDSLLSTCPKKMEIQKWPKAVDSPIYINDRDKSLTAAIIIPAMFK